MKFGQVDNLDLVDFSLPLVSEETKTILSNINRSNNLNFFFEKFAFNLSIRFIKAHNG